jgi:hypothetical protein
MRYAFILLALLAALDPLHAQSDLEVEPDSLMFRNDSPPDTIVVQNAGADALRLDSLDFSTPGTWYLELIYRDSTYVVYYFVGSVLVGFPEVYLAPGERAYLVLEGYDPCPICRGEPVWEDSILFYTDEPLHQPAAVVMLDSSTLQVAEGPPGDERSAISLGSLAPNPVRGSATTTLRLARAGTVRLDLLDARGRWVHTLWQGALGPGPHTLAFDVGALPAGVYFLRATMGDQPPAFQSLVVPF